VTEEIFRGRIEVDFTVESGCDFAGPELVCAVKEATRTAVTSSSQAEFNGALMTGLHLVLPEVVVAEAFEKFAQFVAGGALREIAGLLRSLQHLIFDKDGTVHTQRQRERV
jgi:hypothetical protein